MLEAIFEAKR